MTLIFCESRQLAASRFASAGVTDLKSSHDAGPTFTGELSLRDSQTSPTIERQANGSSHRMRSDDETLEGDTLLTAAVLVAAITLSPMQQAAQIPSEHRAFAACVSARESHGNAKALGDESSAAGKYQFLKPWQQSLPWMVADRLVHFGMPKREARQLRITLQHTGINHWPEAMQDIGFIAVVTASPRGWRHWYLAGSRCNGLAVR